MQDNLELLAINTYQRAREIPFGNSEFQTTRFVIGSQITPERAYRSVLLNLTAKIEALQEAKANLALAQVDADEYQYIIDSPESSEFDKRRAKIKLSLNHSKLPQMEKMIIDALHEVKVLQSELDKYPKYSRKEFESAEQVYFIEKMNRQMNGVQGPAECLANIGEYTALPKIKENRELENGKDS